MHLILLYFSGTGNTEYVAGYLAHKLATPEIEIELRSVEQQPAGSLPDHDMLILGFPVYAGDSPTFLHAYLDSLPPGHGRGAFVFCTKGMLAGDAVRLNLKRLARRGYVPLWGAGVGMPGSDGLAFVGKESRMARSAVAKDFDHLREADRLAGEMAAILTALDKGTPADALQTPLHWSAKSIFSGGPWAWLYQATMDYLRSRFRADDRCDVCGLCARICPAGSIKMNVEGPHFSEGCVLCMRCVHACPQEAIQIGRATKGKFRWKGPKGGFRPLRQQRERP